MVVLKVLREFAAGTNIHGFPFLVSPKSSSRAKVIWAISIVVALSYASWEMRKSVISKSKLKMLLFKYLPQDCWAGASFFPNYADTLTQHNKNLDRHQNSTVSLLRMVVDLKFGHFYFSWSFDLSKAM